MPEPLHPPYLPTATLQPRTLDRWLDVNSQNGPLGRTQTFITLPAFNQPVNWKGYSEIVVAFNFEGPNNFSLTSLGSLPVNPNYMLCISYRVGLVETRYSLWRGVGEVIYFNLLPYTGQFILKNFRLEVWSVNTAPATNSSTLNFYTSVLGAQDYRYGVDSALVSSDTPCTNFQNINAGQILLPTDIGLIHHWIPSGLVAGGSPSWNDSISGTTLTTVGTGNSVQGSAGLTDVSAVLITTGSGDVAANITGAGITLNTIALGFRPSGSSADVFIDSNNDNELLYNAGGGTLTLKNQGSTICHVSGLVVGTWYVVVLTVNTLYVYSMSTGILLGTSSGVCTIGTATTINLGGATGQYVELLLGTIKGTSSDAQSIANYFQSTYFGGASGSSFTLPLTFPTNAVSFAN